MRALLRDLCVGLLIGIPAAFLVVWTLRAVRPIPTPSPAPDRAVRLIPTPVLP